MNTKLDSLSSITLANRIDRIYDHLFANSSVRTPNGIGNEFGKLLHTGLYMETVLKHSPAFSFTPNELNYLLHGDEKRTRELAAKVRDRFVQMNNGWNLYEPSSAISFNDFDLCWSCCHLNGVLLSDAQQDVLGEAVEVFRSQWAKHVGGQFFTDPHVTALAMLLLQFDPRKGDDLIDICAGTGGFLLAGLNHIARLLRESPHSNSYEADVVELACASLTGQEIDPDVCDAANSTLKSRLGERGSHLVTHGDSLTKDVFSSPNSRLRFDSHRCAASNPPFGTKITIKDPAILKDYELARPSRSKASLFDYSGLSPQPPDILFLERNLHMVRPGSGRLAIVLPYQLLSGPRALFVRQWLLRHARIKAVIDLPPETFQPYTGTKTALLVVERNNLVFNDLTGTENYEVFMSMPRWIGHDRRGTPVYKRSLEGRVTNQILTDFDQVQLAYDLYSHGGDPSQAHPGSFKVNYRNIAEDPLLRINALFHRPPLEATSLFTVNSSLDQWKSTKLREVVSDIFYPGRFKRNYVDYFPGAIPFLGGSNIAEFITRTDKWLSPDDPNLEKLKVHSGWILVTRSGTTGIVDIVPEAWDGFAMSEHVIRIVPDEQKLAPEYLLAFLRSKYGQEQLARGVFGSVIDEINPDFLGSLDIHIPSSNRRLDEIVKLVSAGETGRQKGIENHNHAIDRINDMLSS